MKREDDLKDEGRNRQEKREKEKCGKGRIETRKMRGSKGIVKEERREGREKKGIGGDDGGLENGW